MGATEDLHDAREADVDVTAEGESMVPDVPASPPETKRPAPVARPASRKNGRLKLRKTELSVDAGRRAQRSKASATGQDRFLLRTPILRGSGCVLPMP
jgi:hypothetical protein